MNSGRKHFRNHMILPAVVFFILLPIFLKGFFGMEFQNSPADVAGSLKKGPTLHNVDQ